MRQQQQQQQQGRGPPHPGLISAANPRRAARLASRSFYAKSSASEATNQTEVQSLPGNPPPAEAMSPMGWVMPPPGELHSLLPNGHSLPAHSLPCSLFAHSLAAHSARSLPLVVLTLSDA